MGQAVVTVVASPLPTVNWSTGVVWLDTGRIAWRILSWCHDAEGQRRWVDRHGHWRAIGIAMVPSGVQTSRVHCVELRKSWGDKEQKIAKKKTIQIPTSPFQH